MNLLQIYNFQIFITQKLCKKTQQFYNITYDGEVQKKLKIYFKQEELNKYFKLF